MGSLFTKRHRNGKPEGIPGRFTNTSDAVYIISSRDDLLGQDRRPHSVRSQQVSTNWIGSQTGIPGRFTNTSEAVNIISIRDDLLGQDRRPHSVRSQQEIYPWTSSTDVADDPYNTIQPEAESSSQEEIYSTSIYTDVSDDPYNTVPSDAESFSSQKEIYLTPISTDVSDVPYNTVQSDAESFSSQEEIYLTPLSTDVSDVPYNTVQSDAESFSSQAPKERSPRHLCPVHFLPLHTGLCDSNCTDNHRDKIIEFMVEVFKPLIKKRIDPLEVVPYLDFIDSGMIPSIECPQKSVERLIGLIHRSNTPGKWTAFSDALLQAEHRHMHALVNSKTENDKSIQERLMKLRAPNIAQNMCVMDILDKLEEEEVITVTDKERVLAMNRQRGETHAALLLLDLVPNRIEDWDSRFIRTLRACGMAEVADSLEEAMLLKTSHEKVLPENHATETTEVKQVVTKCTRNSSTSMPGAGLKPTTKQGATQEVDITPPELPPRQYAIEDINRRVKSSDSTTVKRRLQERPELPPRCPGTTHLVSQKDVDEASIVPYSVSDSTRKDDKRNLQDDKIHDSRDFSGVCYSNDYGKRGSNQSEYYSVIKRPDKQSFEHQMKNNIDNSEVQGIPQVAKEATKCHQGQLNCLEKKSLLPEENASVATYDNEQQLYDDTVAKRRFEDQKEDNVDSTNLRGFHKEAIKRTNEKLNCIEKLIHLLQEERRNLVTSYEPYQPLMFPDSNARTVEEVCSQDTPGSSEQLDNETGDPATTGNCNNTSKTVSAAIPTTTHEDHNINLAAERTDVFQSDGTFHNQLSFKSAEGARQVETAHQLTPLPTSCLTPLDDKHLNRCHDNLPYVDEKKKPHSYNQGRQNLLERAQITLKLDEVTELKNKEDYVKKETDLSTGTDPLSDAKNAQILSLRSLIKQLVHKVDQLEASLNETKRQNYRYVIIEGPRMYGHTSKYQSQAQLPPLRGPEQLGYHMYAPHTNTQSP